MNQEKISKYNLYENTAWLYDYDNRDNLSADIDFYIDYAIKTGNDVLELGCGTGRVSLMLAEAGANVTALDLSDTMLEIFRKKLDNTRIDVARKVNIIKGNMVDFNLNEKFALIIAPFRTFQALTEDEDIINSIKCIKEHLTDNGLFIVNAFRPYKQLDESWCSRETTQWEAMNTKTGQHIVKMHSGKKIDTQLQIIYPHYTFEITYADGSYEQIEEDLKLKYYYEEQLKKLLVDGGFVILEQYGWYDKSSVIDGRELIFVCRKK